MKKHYFLFPAALMALSVIPGCAAPVTGSDVSVAEETETAAAEEPTREIVEIDPFEGLDFQYHHTKDGEIEENTYTYSFESPRTFFIDGEDRKVQFLSDSQVKGIRKCQNNGLYISIYREVLDEDLKEGDTVTLRLHIEDSKAPEENITEYIEEKYGVRLTQTSKDIKVHFNDPVVKNIDPFEEASVSFYKDGLYLKPATNLEYCKGCKAAKEKGLAIDYELSVVEGKSTYELFIGDKIKYTVVLKAEDKVFKGEKANEYLQDSWRGVHFTETEKEYEVMPRKVEGNYSSSVNVMLTRPENWHTIISNKNRFTVDELRHIDGSTATIPITAELVRQYGDVSDDLIDYYINHNTTGPAYENLIYGRDHRKIILVTEPSAEELQMAADNGVELEVTPIALDGFVFITHKDNPVDSLSVEEIQCIYNGVITNWKDVGGNDEEIVAYQREPNSGSQTVMENMVMAGVDMMEPPKSNVPMTMGGLIEAVATYKNNTCSLGYTFYYYMNNLYKNEDIKVIKINGVSPTNENLLNKSYPFSSGYFAVTIKGGDAEAEKIKDYLISDEGQELIKLAGYCPIR